MSLHFNFISDHAAFNIFIGLVKVSSLLPLPEVHQSPASRQHKYGTLLGHGLAPRHIETVGHAFGSEEIGEGIWRERRISVLVTVENDPFRRHNV